jgi:hypothetical protein
LRECGGELTASNNHPPTAITAQAGSNEMSIKTIPRSEFDRFQPLHFALEGLMGEQIEWFSNQSDTLLGIVAQGKGVANWNYAILKQDAKGDFHVRKVMSNLFSLEAARVDLLLWMAGIEKIDCVTTEDRQTLGCRQLFAL